MLDATSADPFGPITLTGGATDVTTTANLFATQDAINRIQWRLDAFMNPATIICPTESTPPTSTTATAVNTASIVTNAANINLICQKVSLH